MSQAYRGGRRGSVAGYPHQWFDPSSTYMPPSVKELFRWCAYLYASHSEIAPTVDKVCSYAITELVYDTEQDKPRELWRELLEKVLRIREMEFKYLLDYRVFGNAYASLLYPFERYLTCPHCGYEHAARLTKWEYRDYEFYSSCTRCTRSGKMKAKDAPIRNRSRVKLIRWNPQFVDVRHNPLSDDREYIYRIPKWLRERVGNKRVNRMYVETSPIEFLDAIRDRKALQLDSSNIYHFRHAGPSGEDDAYGLPPMMPIFKDAWLYQTYRRAQEAIALEHALPLTVLVPEPSNSGVSPHMNTDMAEWSRRTMEIVHRWRRDQNSIYTAPFPMRVENIRGDAKSLNVFDELTMVRQQITGGLGVPAEFIYGNLTWSGSSVSLRVLENTFLGIIAQLENFLRDFLVPRLGRYFSLPSVRIRHRDFKMADDAQQKQIALSLRQTNTVSDRTVLDELGFDAEVEEKRKAVEAKQRDQQLIEQMVVQAEAQGRALQKQTEYQLKAQSQLNDAMAEKTRTAMNGLPTPPKAPAAQSQQKTAAEAEKTAADAASLPTLRLAPTGRALDLMVTRFLKGPGTAEQKELQMRHMADTDPKLHGAFKTRMRDMRRALKATAVDMRPLPEVKPPRRRASPV